MYKNEDSDCNLSKTQGRNIRIFSYNCRGFGLVTQFCRDLLNMDNNVIPILCNQENFILKGNDYIIQKALPDFHVIFKPATKEHLEGRSQNGMPVNLRNEVKEISPNISRVQAILLDTDSEKLMIMYAYFPQDPKTVTYEQDSDLEDVPAVIENTIDSYRCKNIIIVTDLNTDFMRKKGRVEMFERFLSTNTFKSSWKEFDVDYTHEPEKKGITLYINNRSCTLG